MSSGHRCRLHSFYITVCLFAPPPLYLYIYIYLHIQKIVGEMCGPGLGPDKTSLLSKKERTALYQCADMCELVDFVDDKIDAAGLPGRRPGEGVRRRGQT